MDAARRIQQHSARKEKRDVERIEFIAAHPEVRDVLLSGGDALLVSDEKLEDITEALSYVDYFFPNFEEASEMTGETDEAKVADKLYACGVKNVIMKIGKRGCYIRNADGAMIVPACKGVTAIDTIGAGDNFASGFITGLLEGKDIRECAIYANCTAAVSVQYVGATGGVTDKAIVDKMLAKYREDYK